MDVYRASVTSCLCNSNQTHIDSSSNCCIVILFCVILLCVNFILIWRLLPRASRAIPLPRTSTVGQVSVQQQPEEIEMSELNPNSVSSGAASFDSTLAVSIIQQASIETTASLSFDSSIDTLRQMELKAIKTFLTGFIPLFLLPLPGIIFIFSYDKLCLFYVSFPTEVCNDLTWLLPYVPVVFGLHALASPIMSLRINIDFAPPSPIRRFRIYCQISIYSFLVCCFVIIFFSFLFRKYRKYFVFLKVVLCNCNTEELNGVKIKM